MKAFSHRMFEKFRSRSTSRNLESPATLPKSPFLAVDWSETCITVLQVQLVKNEFQIGGRAFLPWPQEILPSSDASAAGNWLKGELQKNGIPVLPVVACAPRPRGMLKLLQIPDADSASMIKVIHHQIEFRAGAQPGEVVSDFLVLPKSEELSEGLRNVVAVLLPTKVLQQIRETLTAAGAELLSCGFGELALPTFSGDSAGCRIDVLCNHAKMEFVLSCDGDPVASLGQQAIYDASSVTSWLACIERIQLAVAQQLGRRSIDQILFWGPMAEEAIRFCRPHWKAVPPSLGKVTDVDARMLAYLNSLLRKRAVIDFAQPRRAPDPRKEQRRRLRQAGLVAGAICLPFVIGTLQERSRLDREVSKLRLLEKELQQFIERGQPILSQAAFVDRFRSERMDWGNELTNILPLLPESDRAYLNQLTLSQREGTPAAVSLSGLAHSAEDVSRLNRNLLDQVKNCELRSGGIEPNVMDREFNSRFSLELRFKSKEELDAAASGSSRGGAT
ncbi:hypothetical protein SH661x_002375 [Planctomicrobium sp. SH661]|uniref:hypothetical protein n=1 Tax=Planctomicrobium sp. SH661 TaxID=3448124 RepID=UPI003F5C2B5C